MSSAGQPPAPLRPSVFLSYSSDDRPAARALRDALAANGLEVWYDENELGGGDAWDQKIRRQIRDCDYFMPVISASTERRKEGYFRREWRLASERTMDMADDVLFLLPVVIDGTSESAARVPDKFVAVQWLRAPGGQSTPALEALIKRLLAGEHTAPARPPLIGRTAAPFPAAASAPPVAPPPPSGPPPMPAFPHHPPNTGHWARYIAEVLWWVITAGWLLFSRLPRFFRVIIAIWAMITLFGMCKSSTPKKPEKPPTPAEAAANEELKKAIQTGVEETAAAIKSATKDGKGADFGKIGVEMARRFGGKALDLQATGKAIVMMRFGGDTDDTPASRFSQRVSQLVGEQLLLARPTEAAITKENSPAVDMSLLAATGQMLGAGHMLGGYLLVDGEQKSLAVRLIRMRDGTTLWHEDFPVADSDPKVTAEKITAAVLAAVPAKQRK